jgi:hypothetical protein
MGLRHREAGTHTYTRTRACIANGSSNNRHTQCPIHTQAYTAVATVSDSICVMRVGACLQPDVWRLAAASA